MKKILKPSILFILLCRSLYSNSVQTNKLEDEKNCLSNYRISISLDSYEFFINQDIFLNIEFEYLGDKIDSLNLNPTNLSRNVEVKNSNQENADWGGSIDYPVYEKFLPGEKKSFGININSDFGISTFETPNSPKFLYSYLPIDVYSVQYKAQSFQLKSQSFQEKCKKNETISSNIIHFKIVEPTGINKEALEIVKRIYKLDVMGGKEIDEYIRLSNLFIKKYYNTVYINQMFIRQSGYRQLINRYDESALEEAMIILGNHTDREVSRNAISQAYNYYKLNYNEERALQFLEEIRQTYRDLEAGKWAEHELQRIRGN